MKSLVCFSFTIEWRALVNLQLLLKIKFINKSKNIKTFQLFSRKKIVSILVPFTTLCDENMSAFCVNIIMSFGQILTPFSEFVIYVTPIQWCWWKISQQNWSYYS